MKKILGPCQGFSLLFRNGRGVLLTEAGGRLLTAARAVMGDIRALEGEMLALRQDPIGEAVIGSVGMSSRS